MNVVTLEDGLEVLQRTKAPFPEYSFATKGSIEFHPIYGLSVTQSALNAEKAAFAYA